jgi:hypothetical protein
MMLMDDEFVKAVKYGIILQFADGVFRRVFLRLLTYSADYPEKSVSFILLSLSCLSAIIQNTACMHSLPG